MKFSTLDPEYRDDKPGIFIIRAPAIVKPHWDESRTLARAEQHRCAPR